MLLLGQGSGKIDVQRRGRVRRQQVFQKISRSMRTPRVFNSPVRRPFLSSFWIRPEQALDADEVDVRIAPGIFDEEGGIAAASSTSSGRGREQIRQLERLQDGAQFDEQVVHGFASGASLSSRAGT